MLRACSSLVLVFAVLAGCGDPCFHEHFPALEVVYDVSTDCVGSAEEPAAGRIEVTAPAVSNVAGWDVSWSLLSGSLPDLTSLDVGAVCDGSARTTPTVDMLIFTFRDFVYCRVTPPAAQDTAAETLCDDHTEAGNPQRDVCALTVAVVGSP